MPMNESKQQKRLLEHKHVLPYTLNVDNRSCKVTIYTKLGKLSGVTIKEASTNKLVSFEEAKKVVNQLQKYNFWFEYLKKRVRLIRDRDSSVAKKIEQLLPILNDHSIFSNKANQPANELLQILEIFKQQQQKIDIYQEDISLLNEKIAEQGTIYPEDWQNAEDLSLAFATASYIQTLYLEKMRKSKQQLTGFYSNHQKGLPVEKRKQLRKLISFLSDTHGGFVFDQIISLRSLLEKNLSLESKPSLEEQIKEFHNKYKSYSRFFEPYNTKIFQFIRN